MTWTDLRSEIINWRLTRYKFINLTIGLTALFIYEGIGRPFYRPYIYKNGIFDYHLADTLGNSLGTIATLFILVAIFTREVGKGIFVIKVSIISLVLFELFHPLMGKQIDLWDILATVVSGAASYFLYMKIFTQHRYRG